MYCFLLQVGDCLYVKTISFPFFRTHSQSNLLICFIQGSSGNEFYLLDWLNSHPEIRTKSALPNDIEDTGDFIVHQNKQKEVKNEKSAKQNDSINFKDD